MNAHYQVAVVGSGSAGKDAALLAARAGLRTVVIEAGSLGGTGFHRGVNAVRALRACATQYELLTQSNRLGLQLTLLNCWSSNRRAPPSGFGPSACRVRVCRDSPRAAGAGNAGRGGPAAAARLG